MYNCFNCKFAKEKFVSTKEKRMLFYCEKNMIILVAQNYPEYVCDNYEEE